MEYSDGNDEYDNAVKDNHINDDSGSENVEFKDAIAEGEEESYNDAIESESDAKSK